MARSLARGLQAEGYSVEVATDGEQGLARALAEPFDAIVLDLMLPRLNGYAVTRRLRDAGARVPVLMLTAKQGEFDQTEALDTGADDFLSKPFSFVVLVARLRALLRRGSTARPSVLRCGDLSLDPASRRCFRAETPVELTTRELAVLEYLLRRAGEVVSKGEILGHVWDFGFKGDPNVVEVHVSSLRRKVDRPWARASIETVRGAGYRLVDDRA